jgi:hypothetical protein
VKAAVRRSIRSKAAHKSELDAKDAEIKRLEGNRSESPRPVNHQPIETVEGKATDNIADPEERAKAEWKADESLRNAFADENKYVAYRKAQLRGQIKNR